jgi:serine/threonine-protein kinase HipA
MNGSISGPGFWRLRIEVSRERASGAWIVKLPSIAYPHVPENEFAMMDLARRVGIDVPETALLPLTAIQGLPAEIPIPRDTPAYIIRRFDRQENGQRVHTEDFAQVFGVYPERKYEAASYRNIAEAVFSACGDLGLAEFIRRLTFNILIGNGDMHLKNWSLIYFDGRNPSLAPAYDFVSTICYLPQDKLALSLLGSKEFSSLSTDQLKRWAGRSGFPESLVLDVAEDTARRLALVWPMLRDYTLPGSAVDVLEKHIASIPLWRSIL